MMVIYITFEIQSLHSAEATMFGRTYRSNDNLSIDDDRLVSNTVHIEDRRLRIVDDRCAEERPEYARVADREIAAIDVVHRESTLSCLGLVRSWFR